MPKDPSTSSSRSSHPDPIGVPPEQEPPGKIYTQRKIQLDKNVAALAEQLRAMNPKPVLRKRSSLLSALPWMCPAICGADSLEEWVKSHQNGQDSGEGADALLVRFFA